MQDAKVNNQLIQAGPDSPEQAQCPTCGGAVVRRKRRRMDGDYSWFYRHAQGKEKSDCPRRYNPVSVDR
ncbi:MAG: hypothetical protein GY832_42795 [Chloroflexi bacterium]|nr:hypothetical protein [Chloroflexota bacterium]